MRNALSVVSECAPLIKTGGLADVAGALPAAMHRQGWHVTTLLPGYPKILAATGDAEAIEHYPSLFGGPARLLSARAAGLDLLILDAPHLYDRGGTIYLDVDGRDWPDNPERFAALSWTAAHYATTAPAATRPAVLHLHDWQAGLTPVYLNELAGTERPGTLFTIHNIGFHGLSDPERLASLRLPRRDFTLEGFEFYGKISALKAGLVFSDKLSTVSPQYAEELMEPEFGMGMDGVLRWRRNDITGILNGIDDTVWNPATDPVITRYKTPRGKARNKARLRRIFGLEPGDGPLAVIITRMTLQKGIDLLLEALSDFLAEGGQIAMLGSGDRRMELAWERAAAGSPSIGVRIGYDEELAHRMMAGGDAILVPSRFEPCGLTQLYGLRYGTIPVVARTGGLSDTVIHANEAAIRAGVATGIQFAPDSVEALRAALRQLSTFYRNEPLWQRLQRNAMAQAVDWDPSARQYAALYEEISATT